MACAAHPRSASFVELDLALLLWVVVAILFVLALLVTPPDRPPGGCLEEADEDLLEWRACA